MVIKMKKNFRSVRASIAFGILLISVFMVLVPTYSADETEAEGGLIAYNHVVEVTWANIGNATLEIKPYSAPRAYEIEITHSLSKSLFGRTLYQLFYSGRTVDMTVTIKSYPTEWSTVTAFSDVIQLTLPDIPERRNDYDYSLLISLDDDAPAFERGKIALGINIEAYGMIDEYNQEITLDMTPDYAPKLNYIADVQSKIIGPMDTATIPIQVTNIGNGESKIYFNVPDIPSGWTALVTDQITLAPDQTETIYLTIKPPKGFGYHDDAHTFKVEFYPTWPIDPTKKGITEQVTVSIESRGISIIGGEIVFPIIILIIIAIYLTYYFVKKYRQK